MGAPAEAENSLPIDSVLPEIVSSLRACPNLVLRAPTGAGKTTASEEMLAGITARGGRAVVCDPQGS